MEPGISSAGRPVSTPTDTFLSIDLLAELFFSKELAQALTVNAATKPPILLYGVRQLDPNIFYFFAQLGVGILQLVLIIPDPCQDTLACGQFPFGLLFTILGIL